MKKKLIYSLSLLSLFMILSSCGGGQTSNPTSSENELSSEENVSSSDESLSDIISGEEVIDFSGTGSESDPYIINTKAGLNTFAKQFADGTLSENPYIELSSDIDYEYDEWSPIGTLDNPFSGRFNGKGYTIKNIKISQFEDEIGDYSIYGFFGFTQKADIRNVNFEAFDLSLNVYGKDHIVYVGGLVGYSNNTYIHNVDMDFANFNVKSLQNGNSGIYAGGISGFLQTSSDDRMYYVDVTNSSVTGDINLNMKNSATTISYAGGIAGTVYTGYFDGIYAVNNCYHNGSVTSGTYAGGIAGYISSLTSIVDSYAYGESITTTDSDGSYVGGITGAANYETAIMNCYASYNTLSAPTTFSSSYTKSYAGEIAGFYVEEDYADGSYYLGTAIYNSYSKEATLSADNVSNVEHKEASASLFKDTLKYNEKAWDLSTTYPTLLDTYSSYKVNVTLDDNYDAGGSSSYEADANNYNAELSLIISEKSLSRDNYSFSGYYYDEECSVAYRFYTPFNSDLTLYAGWTDLSSLIGTYTYSCDYYGEIISTGTWKFDEKYFYWISLDNAVMQYEYSFDGKNIFIGSAVVGPMGEFVGGYEDQIFTYNEDGTITAYDVNDYSAVYTGTKSSTDIELPSYEDKAYLGRWYSVDTEVNLYSDGNAKARSYKTSTVYYYGGFIDNDGVLDISCFGKVSGDFKYDETNEVLYSNSKIFVREEVKEAYASSDSSVLVAITEEKTYIIANGEFTSSYSGEFKEGEKVTINGVSYTLSNSVLLQDEEIEDGKEEELPGEEMKATYLGSWSGKVGIADVTIVIYENGTLTYNGVEKEYTVEGNVISAPDLTITYNENNQSIYVDFLWDGYESITGTMTNYTPFEEEVDQSKYVGTYKNQHGATMTLDSEGNGAIVIEGGVTRTFKYVVTSDGITISDWNDPSYEYEVESVTVNSNGTIDFEMCYDYSSYYTWTFSKVA